MAEKLVAPFNFTAKHMVPCFRAKRMASLDSPATFAHVLLTAKLFPQRPPSVP